VVWIEAMVKTGLEIILEKFPRGLKGKRIGVLCHAPSVTRDFSHISDLLFKNSECKLTAVFGPQHGLFGQTQDNMIEWSGEVHPVYRIPLFSLYGEHRKPTPVMLENIDLFLVDLQDVGARLYTYIWTVKHCMEACSEAGIPVWILDRPNPIAAVDFDGPVLKEEFFTFVGGACIPMCHRMTIGEIAVWIKEKHVNKCDLKVIWMKGWNRSMMFNNTGLPWVIPSPNMPTLNTAIVYPGTVLFEATNISEGRGTTIPFELFGAPSVNSVTLKEELEARNIKGCAFRFHNFIPTFNKFSSKLCNGIQIHVTDIKSYRPVITALEILDSIIKTTSPDTLEFKYPPYEYEFNIMPFDILAGDSVMRNNLIKRVPVENEKLRWASENEVFRKEFYQLAAYPEN
jgi:uncharacterized protein YbbC (DUF1343 family)